MKKYTNHTKNRLIVHFLSSTTKSRSNQEEARTKISMTLAELEYDLVLKCRYHLKKTRYQQFENHSNKPRVSIST